MYHCVQNICSNLSLSNWWRETKLFEFVTSLVTKHKRKWMSEFLTWSESRFIKVIEFNSICITISINLLQFRNDIWVRCDVDIFKLTARAWSSSREVYVPCHQQNKTTKLTKKNQIQEWTSVVCNSDKCSWIFKIFLKLRTLCDLSTTVFTFFL